MKTIRLNVFETNSSSMHALILANGGALDFNVTSINFALNKDFSLRTLITHTSPDAKASYIFQLIALKINKYFKSTANCFTEEEVNKITAYNKRVIKFFELFQQKCIDFYKKKYDLTVTFSNYTIKEYDYLVYITHLKDEYCSLGCYGNDAVIAVLLNDIFLCFDKIAENEFDCIDENSTIDIFPEYWRGLSIIRDFILGKNDVIIQCTDECSAEMLKNMKKEIKKYIQLNDYECQVIWPIGG